MAYLKEKTNDHRKRRGKRTTDSKAADAASFHSGLFSPPLPGTAMRGDQWKLPGDTPRWVCEHRRLFYMHTFTHSPAWNTPVPSIIHTITSKRPPTFKNPSLLFYNLSPTSSSLLSAGLTHSTQTSHGSLHMWGFCFDSFSGTWFEWAKFALQPAFWMTLELTAFPF